jgi:hypothetical protein
MDAAPGAKTPRGSGDRPSSRSLPSLVGAVAVRALLGAVYWAVVTPLGAALRVSRRPPLDLDFRGSKSSYWIAKETSEQTLRRYEKPY